MVKLLSISIVAGWLSGALGMGGGSIYSPCLLAMGVNPQVAGATGMYLVIFTSLNSCIANYQGSDLNLEYGIWLSLLASLTSLLSLFIADFYHKRTSKQST